MRNPAIGAFDRLVGEWSVTLTNAWFLESLDVRQHGRAVFRWLGEAFVELQVESRVSTCGTSCSAAVTRTTGSLRCTTTPDRRPGCSP